MAKKLKSEIENVLVLIEQKSSSAAANNKLRVLEDRNRRNNLRINGMEENDGETWKQTWNGLKKRYRTY